MPVKKPKSCPDQNSLDFFKMQTENISLHDEIDRLRGIIADSRYETYEIGFHFSASERNETE